MPIQLPELVRYNRFLSRFYLLLSLCTSSCWSWILLLFLAPGTGLEPVTHRLTGDCSAIELAGNALLLSPFYHRFLSCQAWWESFTFPWWKRLDSNELTLRSWDYCPPRLSNCAALPLFSSPCCGVDSIKEFLPCQGQGKSFHILSWWAPSDSNGECFLCA